MESPIYYAPIIMQNMLFFIFIAIFECSYQNSYFSILLRKFQELAAVLHDFVIAAPTELALFYRSSNLWASSIQLTSENVMVFMYRWMRSPRKCFLILLSVQFILLFSFEKIASTLVSYSTTLVMNFSPILLEHIPVCFINICSAI